MGVKTGQNFEDFIEFVEITGNKGLKVIWDRQNEEKLYDGLPLAALAVILVMGGAGVGTRWWQIYKKYLPQKESLVLLRTTLISTGAKP
ncbi:MAG: hypothetical protein R2932_42310 [Caldilineaceae bacterium]